VTARPMADDDRSRRAAERERAGALQDLEEGRAPVPVLDAAGAQDLLRHARRIAVVGASPDRDRPSHSVMRYLQAQGYDCVPINPTARDVLGVPTFASLEEAVAASGPFDIVDVFRRAEWTPAIAASAVATGCHALWLQLGVVDWTAAGIAQAGGLALVMDRCTAIEHRKLRGR
jgi:predicted CoA-binding protein